MTRTPTLAIVILLAACAGSPDVAPSPEPAPSPAPTVGPTSTPAAVGYVILPPGERIELAATCQMQGPEGDLILRGELPGGGAIQLRRTGEGDASAFQISLLPSADADPVATREVGDTTWTETDGVISGTTTLWLGESGDERMEVEFGIRWDESVPECTT